MLKKKGETLLRCLFNISAAYFYASTGRNANSAGFRLRDENGSPEVIRKYRKEGVTLTLPEGKTLNNIKIFYVWCEEFEVSGLYNLDANFHYNNSFSTKILFVTGNLQFKCISHLFSEILINVLGNQICIISLKTAFESDMSR